MTHLKIDDIQYITSQLDQYDRQLHQMTGNNLRSIACRTQGISEIALQSVMDSVLMGVVPIRSGQGVIEGFSDTVKNIVQHIGFKVFVTQETDVAGIAEAVERKARVVMMADDYRFVALNVLCECIVDNADATGRGFVTGMDLMAGGLKGQKVLVIGCGPVGRSAVLTAITLGAEVSVFDINFQRSHQLAQEVKKKSIRTVVVEKSLDMALQNHHLLVDATNAPDIIDKETITLQTYIVAPGMPLGLTPEAVEKISNRLLHDPLQLGVAVMALDAASRI